MSVSDTVPYSCTSSGYPFRACFQDLDATVVCNDGNINDERCYIRTHLSLHLQIRDLLLFQV